MTALAFSPDGNTLAVAGKAGALRLWNTTSHQPLGEALPTSGDPVLSVAFTSDGTELRAAGQWTRPQTYTVSPGRAADAVCRRAGGGLPRADWSSYLPDVAYARPAEPMGNERVMAGGCSVGSSGVGVFVSPTRGLGCPGVAVALKGFQGLQG